MRLDFSGDRLLAVVAHPDDAELLCAGTLARAKQDGAAIGLCVMCRGDKGQPQGRTIRNLGEVRQAEMQAAADVLGAQLFRGGIGDSELRDDVETRATLVGILRDFRPTLVLAHAENDYHVDHRTASQLAEVASWQCASNNRPQLGEPLTAPPALWWMDTINMHGFQPQFFIDVSSHVDLKRQMLACHQSQLSRSEDQDFTSLPDLMRNQYETRGRQASVPAAEAFRSYHAFKRSRAW